MLTMRRKGSPRMQGRRGLLATRLCACQTWQSGTADSARDITADRVRSRSEPGNGVCHADVTLRVLLHLVRGRVAVVAAAGS